MNLIYKIDKPSAKVHGHVCIIHKEEDSLLGILCLVESLTIASYKFFIEKKYLQIVDENTEIIMINSLDDLLNLNS